MNKLKKNIFRFVLLSILLTTISSCNIWPYRGSYDKYPYSESQSYSKIFKLHSNLDLRNSELTNFQSLNYKSFSYVKIEHPSKFIPLLPKFNLQKLEGEELESLNAVLSNFFEKELPGAKIENNIFHVLNTEIAEYAFGLFYSESPTHNELLQVLKIKDDKNYIYPIIADISVINEHTGTLFRKVIGLQVFVLNQNEILFSKSGFVVSEGMYDDSNAYFHQYHNELEVDFLLLANLILNNSESENYE